MNDYSNGRKSAFGTFSPSWLPTSGKTLIKKNISLYKDDPLIEELDVIQCNPGYAHVHFPKGMEDTASVRQLAPVGEIHNSKFQLID